MLHHFRHHLHTDFLFGKDTEKQIGVELKRLGAKKVLIGHDSGKFLYETGLLQNVKGYLASEGIEVLELGGIQPNPRLSLVRKGIELCRKEGVDFLLAIGGGSAIDTCKAVGAGCCYDGDVWELTREDGVRRCTKALPLAVLLTYPAAGSESSKSAIVTNDQLPFKVKATINDPCIRPVIAFENPALTYTLPRYLTACGVCDMYVHILERYFSPVEVGCMDYLSEGMLRALLNFGPKVLEEPENYDYRAEIMWIGTIAHNNTVGLGRPNDWATHYLGHEMSALYDTPHAASLTIVGESWMKAVYKDHLSRFARYAREVFGIEEADEEKAALSGIAATKDFYKKMGLPTSFREGHVPTDQIEAMARQAVDLKGGRIGGMKRLTYEDCVEIYQNAAG